jgi:AbrB family looped-hinge helix DNA binding protein
MSHAKPRSRQGRVPVDLERPAEQLTVTVSTGGRVTVPRAIWRQRGWAPGTRLIVKEKDEGVLLVPAPLFPATEIDAVCGSLAFSGRRKTVEELSATFALDAKRSDMGEV